MDRLRAIEREGLRSDVPDFKPGDTVKVMVRVKEGDKTRNQAFEGVCIGRRSGGINESFTVRKISAGVGVERIFPLHSPSIASIELVRRGRVRRAKLGEWDLGHPPVGDEGDGARSAPVALQRDGPAHGHVAGAVGAVEVGFVQGVL